MKKKFFLQIVFCCLGAFTGYTFAPTANVDHIKENPKRYNEYGPRISRSIDNFNEVYNKSKELGFALADDKLSYGEANFSFEKKVNEKDFYNQDIGKRLYQLNSELEARIKGTELKGLENKFFINPQLIIPLPEISDMRTAELKKLILDYEQFLDRIEKTGYRDELAKQIKIDYDFYSRAYCSSLFSLLSLSFLFLPYKRSLKNEQKKSSQKTTYNEYREEFE